MNKVWKYVVFTLALISSNFGIAHGVNPSTPSNISAVVITNSSFGNGSISVKWNSVSGADSYAIKLTRVSTGEVKSETVAGENTTSITFNNLIGGSLYRVQVRSISLSDLSLWSSDTMTVTPVTAPAQPERPNVLAGDASATVSWTKIADADNGGSAITGYLIREINSGVSVNVASDIASVVFTGLTRGSVVEFTVTAQNGASTAGTTSQKSDSIILPDVPGTPSAPTLSVGSSSGAISVTWIAPTSNGGSAITGYIVKLYKDGILLNTIDVSDLSNLTRTYSNLENGSYTAKIIAKNSLGESSLSSASVPLVINVTQSGANGNTNSGSTNTNLPSGGGVIATPTPSPSPTATPTPSPSPTPSATPTPSPSPTPSATPTPSPSPTATPTLSPSPTATPKTSSTPKSTTPKFESEFNKSIVKSLKENGIILKSQVNSALHSNLVVNLKFTQYVKPKVEKVFAVRVNQTKSGKVILKIPAGKNFLIANYASSDKGYLKLPVISFQKSGVYTISCISGTKSSILKIRVK